jgi:hypothetical protein
MGAGISFIYTNSKLALLAQKDIFTCQRKKYINTFALYFFVNLKLAGFNNSSKTIHNT